jgi:uncharacterized protein (DUF1697 family)
LSNARSPARWVVFLRAANVGKHNRFQPSALAKDLAQLDVVNVGAVGTFIVWTNVSETSLRSTLLRKLPIKCEVMICRANEIVDLVLAAPFKDQQFDNDFRAFVTVMAKRPTRLPKLPIYAPDIKNWEVKILEFNRACVLSLWRRRKQNPLYPNQVIEKQFGIATTTRSWNTIQKISELVTKRSD